MGLLLEFSESNCKKPFKQQFSHLFISCLTAYDVQGPVQEKDNVTVNKTDKTLLPHVQELSGERVRGPGKSSPTARVTAA